MYIVFIQLQFFFNFDTSKFSVVSLNHAHAAMFMHGHPHSHSLGLCLSLKNCAMAITQSHVYVIVPKINHAMQSRITTMFSLKRFGEGPGYSSLAIIYCTIETVAFVLIKSHKHRLTSIDLIKNSL